MISNTVYGKYHVAGGVLILFLLACTVSGAEAQHVPDITLTLDRQSYQFGDTVYVSGLINVDNGGAVTLTVSAPNGAIVGIGQVEPVQRSYQWGMPVTFQTDGEYVVNAYNAIASEYGPATSSFTYVSPKTIPINGTSHTITHTGTITKAWTDPAASLLYVEGAGSGMMWLGDDILQGDIIPVVGEWDGTTYTMQDGRLVLSAGAVPIPEFPTAYLAMVAGMSAVAVVGYRMVARGDPMVRLT